MANILIDVSDFHGGRAEGAEYTIPQDDVWLVGYGRGGVSAWTPPKKRQRSGVVVLEQKGPDGTWFRLAGLELTDNFHIHLDMCPGTVIRPVATGVSNIMVYTCTPGV